jgi:hypothetical protein
VGGDAVQKPAVMADDHGAAAEVFQGLFQRPHGVDVQVVGGFVQQQHIGSGFEHAGQVHPVALPAGEHPHFFLLVGLPEKLKRAT